MGSRMGLRVDLATPGNLRPLEEFGYADVTLNSELHEKQLQSSHQVLMDLSEDSLLKPLREMAGQPARNVPPQHIEFRRGHVARPQYVTVRAQDISGKEFEMRGEGLLARAFCHEIDHLNGILFITHLSMLKRDLIKRKIRKLKKAGDW